MMKRKLLNEKYVKNLFYVDTAHSKCTLFSNIASTHIRSSKWSNKPCFIITTFAVEWNKSSKIFYIDLKYHSEYLLFVI